MCITWHPANISQTTQIGDNHGFTEITLTHHTKECHMGNKVVTEAMRKATPPLPGTVVRKLAIGQKRSLERGAHTRSKKNPGKRPHQG